MAVAVAVASSSLAAAPGNIANARARADAQEENPNVFRGLVAWRGLDKNIISKEKKYQCCGAG